MFWFILWTCLLGGTLVGAFFLAQDLFRKASGVFEELGNAAGALERLEQPVPTVDPPTSSVGEDPVVVRQRLDELRQRRRVRHAQRQKTHARTYRQWRVLSGSSDASE